MSSSSLESLLPRSVVYGDEGVRLDDPAERFHEASKLYPSLGVRQTAGIARLAGSDALQAATFRCVRGNPQRETCALPPAALPAGLARGRSVVTAAHAPLACDAFAAVLHAGYGMHGTRRRTVPSAGALYPLELYPVAVRVDGVREGVYHYDPQRHLLERVREGAVAGELSDTCPLPGLLDGATAVVFVTAVFWRTRFKYGLRGYRFALLEAGHCAQNMLVAAHGLGLDALPLGGFYDARAEALVAVDGVEEAVVYAVVLS